MRRPTPSRAGGLGSLRHAALAIAFSIALTLPFTGSLAIVPAPRAEVAVPMLPADLGDAELLILLARLDGLHLSLPTQVQPAPDDTVADAVLRLATRGGATLTIEDAAAFDALDARVAAPVLTLLVAIERAWDLTEQAFPDLTADDLAAMRAQMREGDRAALQELLLAEPADREALVNSAILVLDTAESIAIPALQEAVNLGVWPPIAIADPVGVLRVGGSGDDIETIDRVLQIDGQGNDRYLNNAGGTTILTDLKDRDAVRSPVSLSIDLAGDDTYDSRTIYNSQGAGTLGPGILLELNGDDDYNCPEFCQGLDNTGLGFLRDYEGNDFYRSVGPWTLGVAGDFIGVARDDGGDDVYLHYDAFGGGYAYQESATGILWDRGGRDEYRTGNGEAFFRYGWGEGGGRGWLIDEGSSIDYYETENAENPFYRHGCNDCTWIDGGGISAPASGRGNDNDGGLARLMADDNALSPRLFPSP